ncbi:hypothetical protein KDA_69500 [Dictyobacter alpinus]|uniref:DUF4199 domain-containing protein n=1 Tax=Dictyobacter alpinus TaxID=2014873 RepID=A0A402BJE9_9CHLR|nr:hypothetical protein [Dictyobacter alpinus]GCE31466.1 hypothetical protein KDA_69500 [Dictyobacter alpinus]
MQHSYYQSAAIHRRSNIALTSGLTLAMIAGLVIFGIGFWTDFHNFPSNNAIPAVAFLIALFGTPFLAGLIGTLGSGRVDTGSGAGVWTGFIVGLFLGIYVYIFSLFNPPIIVSPQLLQQLHDQLAQRGILISIQSIQINLGPQLPITTILIIDALIMIIWIGINTLIATIGALIGKIFSPRPRDYVRARTR